MTQTTATPSRRAAVTGEPSTEVIAGALTAAGHTQGRVGVSGFLLRSAFPAEGTGIAVHYLDYDLPPAPAQVTGDALGAWARTLEAAGFTVADTTRPDGTRPGLIVTGGAG
jgi:hypothetical protein